MQQVRYPAAMRRLINELSKLPSIGEKSAIRMAYQLVSGDEHQAQLLATSIQDCQRQIQFCTDCFFLAEAELCEICQDESRETVKICVVEKPADVLAVERSGGYSGLYHVLHGLWSPLKGCGPDQTKLAELFKRIVASRERGEPIQEVVIATGTTVEGDATAMYIGQAIQEFGIGATRIAQGMPKGGELEFADEITLNHAMQGRRQL